MQTPNTTALIDKTTPGALRLKPTGCGATLIDTEHNAVMEFPRYGAGFFVTGVEPPWKKFEDNARRALLFWQRGPALVKALADLVGDGECYCAAGSEKKCPHCLALAELRELEQGATL